MTAHHTKKEEPNAGQESEHIQDNQPHSNENHNKNTHHHTHEHQADSSAAKHPHKPHKEEQEQTVDAAVVNEPEVITPEQLLAQKDAEIAAAQDKFLRLNAEYQNYRRRVLKDIAVAKTIVLEDTLMPFLQVFDYLTMAMSAAAASDNINSIREGLKMIMNEYQKAMDELGVAKIDALGTAFNPELHEALAHEVSEDPEGKVIKQWNYGYKLGEKLLRPAKVVVSSGPEQKDQAEKQ
jgi:molecular chaperone GrpE